MRKVFVTGASGLIGTAVLPELAALGFEVFALTSGRRRAEAGEGGEAGNSPGEGMKAGEAWGSAGEGAGAGKAEAAGIARSGEGGSSRRAGRVAWLEGDVFDRPAMDALLAQVRPSHLLHLAWESTGHFDDPRNFGWLAASLDLLRAFADHGGKRAVMAGTYAEYGHRSGLLRESMPPMPINAYSLCKARLCTLGQELSSACGLSFGWARLFSVFGRERDARRLTGEAMRKLAAGEPVTIRSGGLVRDYIYVKDAASALARFLESDVQGAVNVCGGHGTSIRDYVLTLARAMGREGLVRFEDAPGAQQERVVGDCSRLTQEVGFIPQWSLEDAMRDMLAAEGGGAGNGGFPAAGTDAKAVPSGGEGGPQARKRPEELPERGEGTLAAERAEASPGEGEGEACAHGLQHGAEAAGAFAPPPAGDAKAKGGGQEPGGGASSPRLAPSSAPAPSEAGGKPCSSPASSLPAPAGMPGVVSVLLSIYDVEEYLEECLDSLLAQSYPHLEIVCVDNGSPDGCAAILERYAARDSRIKVVTVAENRRLCGGRNAGLDHATGEFICFVDPDDWVEEDYIRSMVDAMQTARDGEGRPYELIVNYNFQSYMLADGKVKVLFGGNDVAGHVGLDDYNKDVSIETNIPMWGRLYRASFLRKHGVRFLDGFQTDNIPFSQKLLAHMERFYCITEAQYPRSCYWRRMLSDDGALTATVLYKNMEIPDCLEDLYDYLKAHGLEGRLKVMFRLMFTLCFPRHRDMPAYWRRFRALAKKMEDDVKTLDIYDQDDRNLSDLLLYSNDYFQFCDIYFRPAAQRSAEERQYKVKLFGRVTLFKKRWVLGKKSYYYVLGIPWVKTRVHRNGDVGVFLLKALPLFRIKRR